MVYTPLMKINTVTNVAVINSSSNKITEIDRGGVVYSIKKNLLNSLF